MGVEPLTWAAQSTGENFITSVSRMTGPAEAATRIWPSTSTATSGGQETLSLDTATNEGDGHVLGTEPRMMSYPLTAALDEVYIYARALDASAVAVLYGSVSAAPTVTPVPTSHLFEGSLVAYYPFVDGTTQDAHHTWNGYPESMTTTEGRDGRRCVGARRSAVWLPWEVVRDLDGDADRTVCLWARIDLWNGGYLFHYGGSSDPGSYAPTLQDTYEPTVEESRGAAGPHDRYKPSRVPKADCSRKGTYDRRAPRPTLGRQHGQDRRRRQSRRPSPRPTYPSSGDADRPSAPCGRRGGGDGSRTTNRPNSMRPLACASAPRKAI